MLLAAAPWCPQVVAPFFCLSHRTKTKRLRSIRLQHAARTAEYVPPNYAHVGAGITRPRIRYDLEVSVDTSLPWPVVDMKAGGVSVSVLSDWHVQGRAVAITIFRFHWKQYLILRCASEACERMNTAFTEELSRLGDEYHSVGEVKLIEPPADDEELTAWGEELKQAADVLLHNHSHPTTREHACKPFKYDGPCHVCSSIVCARELL